MYLQGINLWVDVFSKIFGSFLATLFAVFAWYIIELAKKRAKHKNLKKNLIKLYHLFEDRSFSPQKPADILNLFYEIGERQVFKILKLQFGDSLFSGNPFSLRIMYESLISELVILEENLPFNYKQPKQNPIIHQGFMDFFVSQCKSQGIIIKTNDRKRILNPEIII